MLTFISPNVCLKLSNSWGSITKMTKQSFGPIWHRAVYAKGWKAKNEAEQIEPQKLFF
jgi:hypothetical protein